MAWTEKAGIPAVGIVCEGFQSSTLSVAEGEGLRGVRLVVYPPPHISVHTRKQIYAYAENLLDKVIEALTVEAAAEILAAAVVEPGPREIVFAGTFEEVNNFFYDRLWTDGLPIVPPTIEKVEEFLKYTDRSPDEVLGVLRPSNCEAIVWTVAVNGVMAGCRPEYMPVLIAVIEAVADSHFRIEEMGSTGGGAPIITLNGPIRNQLDFNSGQGVLRNSRRANATIGRFLRLFFVNVPRFLVGSTDKSTFGCNFFVVLAENEESSPWEPLSVDLGFKPGTNVVTVGQVFGWGPQYTTRPGGGAIALRDIVIGVEQVIGKMRHAYFLPWPEQRHLVVLSPLVAQMIADLGFSKSDIQRYIYENARQSAFSMDEDSYSGTLCEHVKKGLLPKHFCVEDPKTLLPLTLSPDQFRIIVSGDPNRNRIMVLRGMGYQGQPTSKEIMLPANWEELRAKLRK